MTDAVTEEAAPGGGPGAAPLVVARMAVAADVPEVVRLAIGMYRALDAEPPAAGGWPGWAQRTEAVLADRLGRDVVVFVVDDPARPGALVSCGAGTVWSRLPNAWHEDTRVGYVQWMSTDPEFRRRGLSRAVLRALVGWFDEAGIQVVELHASTMGEPLYRSEGFGEGRWGVALRRRPGDPDASGDGDPEQECR